MKNKTLPLTAVFFLFIYLRNSNAEEKRGAELVVQKKDGQSTKGELIVVKPSTLLLLDAQSGSDVSVSIDKVRYVKIVKNPKANALKWAGLGYLISAAAICGLWLATDPGGISDPEGGGPLVVALIAGIPGLFVGAGVGAILGTDEEIQFDGMAPKVLEKALKYLEKKARLSEFR
jgi:hypothetical protein